MDGLGGPMDGLAGLIHRFSFFLFDLLKQVSNHLEKDLIYHDLSTKAVEFSAVHGRNYKATITAEFHSMVIETVQLLC